MRKKAWLGATGRGTPRPVLQGHRIRHRSASTPTRGTRPESEASATPFSAAGALFQRDILPVRRRTPLNQCHPARHRVPKNGTRRDHPASTKAYTRRRFSCGLCGASGCTTRNPSRRQGIRRFATPPWVSREGRSSPPCEGERGSKSRRCHPVRAASAYYSASSSSSSTSSGLT